MSASRWTEAQNVYGLFVATPVAVTATPLPAAPTGYIYDDAFWYVVGRWVGDGWVRMSHIPTRKRRNSVVICTSHEDAGLLAARLAMLCHHVGQRRESTVVKFEIHGQSLPAWLTMHFGRGASRKTIPGWLLGVRERWRRAFLDGYLDADGSARGACTTVSRCLSVGIGMMAHTLNKTVHYSVGWGGGPRMIQGRTVQTRPQYSLVITDDDGRYTECGGTLRWRKVRRRSMPSSAETDVFDLEVSEDHSFVADGVVVHNCQMFSTLANLVRANGYEPKFGNLIPEYERVVREAAPVWFLMEEVPGAPIPEVAGYAVHAFIFRNEWLGEEQERCRRFSFGVRGAEAVNLKARMECVALMLPGRAFSLVHTPVCAFDGGGQARSSRTTAVVADRRATPVKLGGSGKIKPGARAPAVSSAHAGAKSPRGGHLVRYRLADACRLQGLPEGFLEDAPFTAQGKLKAVANGVPIPLGRAIAKAIRSWLADTNREQAEATA